MPIPTINPTALTWTLKDARDFTYPVSILARTRESAAGLVVNATTGTLPTLIVAGGGAMLNRNGDYVATLRPASTPANRLKGANLGAELRGLTLPDVTGGGSYTIGVGWELANGDGAWALLKNNAGVIHIVVRVRVGGVATDSLDFDAGISYLHTNASEVPLGLPTQGIAFHVGLFTTAAYGLYTAEEAGVEGGMAPISGLDLRPLLALHTDAALAQIRPSVWVEQSGGTGSFGFTSCAWGQKGPIHQREVWPLQRKKGGQYFKSGREYWIADSAMPYPARFDGSQWGGQPRYVSTHQYAFSTPIGCTDLSDMREEAILLTRHHGVTRVEQDVCYVIDEDKNVIHALGPNWCYAPSDVSWRSIGLGYTPIMRGQIADAGTEGGALFSGEISDPSRVIVTDMELWHEPYDEMGASSASDFVYDVSVIWENGRWLVAMHRNQDNFFYAHLFESPDLISVTKTGDTRLLGKNEGGKFIQFGGRVRFIAGLTNVDENGHLWIVCHPTSGEKLGGLAVGPDMGLNNGSGYCSHPGITPSSSAGGTRYRGLTFDGSGVIGFGISNAETVGRTLLITSNEVAGDEYEWEFEPRALVPLVVVAPPIAPVFAENGDELTLGATALTSGLMAFYRDAKRVALLRVAANQTVTTTQPRPLRPENRTITFRARMVNGDVLSAPLVVGSVDVPFDTSQAYAHDAFAGVPGAAVESRNGEVSKLVGTGLVLTRNGTARPNAGGYEYYHSENVMPTADVSVAARFHLYSSLTVQANLYLRADAAGNSQGYTVSYKPDSARWEIVKLGGGFPTIASVSGLFAIQMGGSVMAEFRIEGSLLTLHIDGILALSEEDETYPAAGYAGLLVAQQSGPYDDENGMALGDFVARPLPVAVAAILPSIESATTLESGTQTLLEASAILGAAGVASDFTFVPTRAISSAALSQGDVLLTHAAASKNLPLTLSGDGSNYRMFEGVLVDTSAAPVPIDTTAPAAPTLNVVAGNAHALVSMIAPNEGVVLKLKRGTTQIYSDDVEAGEAVSHTDSGLTNGVAQTYSLTATDAAGNVSAAATQTVTPTAPVVEPPADTTRPTILSGSLNSDGVTLPITFSEPVNGNTGLTIKVAGANRAFTMAGSGANRTLTLASPATYGQIVTRSYTPGNITDLAATPNALAAFTDVTVANNVAAPVIEPPAPGGEVTLSEASVLAVATALFELQRGGGDLLFDPLVQDTDGFPIADASVSLRRLNSQGEVESATWRQATTGASGRVEFGDVAGFVLPTGNYLVLVRAGGFAPFAPQPLNLLSDTAPIYALESLPPLPLPDEAGFVTVVLDLSDYGVPKAGVKATLQVDTRAKTVKIGGRYDAITPMNAWSDADGRVTWEKVPPSAAFEGEDGLPYKATCEDPYVSERFFVPDTGGNVHDLPKIES